MSSDNVLNEECLAEVFGIELGNTETFGDVFSTKDTDLVIKDANLPSTIIVPITGNFDLVDIQKATTVEDELQALLKQANGMLKGAQYLINTSPNAESIAAAAALITSITNLISEFNKTVLQAKRFSQIKDLEILKNKLKQENMHYKSELEKLNKPLGKGNTFNVQNNNYIAYKQEDVVKTIIQQQKSLLDINP
jgi:hypothetical protein